MDSVHFTNMAKVTLSNLYHGEKVGKQLYVRSLNDAIDAANKLDRIKKSLFYGKDNNLEPADGLQDVSVTPDRLANLSRKQAEIVIHTAIGCFTESGELLEALKEATNKGNLDIPNVVEECGDLLWYLAILLDTLDSSLGEAMGICIAKLQDKFAGRYRAAGFTAGEALQRDLEAERAVMAAASQKALETVANASQGDAPPFASLAARIVESKPASGAPAVAEAAASAAGAFAHVQAVEQTAALAPADSPPVDPELSKPVQYRKGPFDR